jgi:hypothetical protein
LRIGAYDFVGRRLTAKVSAGKNQLAGDLAVTQAGSHVLVYLGGDLWIEAEPEVGATHIFDLKGKFNYLADQEVRSVRWIYLNATDDDP